MTEEASGKSEAEQRGDAILKRMLKTKPKPHSEVAEESKAKRKAVRNSASQK